MRRTTGFSWVLGAALCASTVAWAEGPDDGPGPGPGPKHGPGPGHEGRPFQKRALEKMRTMRLLEIQSALNLDEATTLKLSAIFKRHDALRDKMFEAVRKEMQALRALAREAKPDDAKLSAAVDRLVALRQKMPEIQAGQVAEARKVLTPLQQAKLVLHMAKFKKHFRNMMHKSFMRRGGHGGPGGGPAGGGGPGMGPGRGRGPRPGGPGGGAGGDPEMGPSPPGPGPDAPPPRNPAGGNPAGGNPGAPVDDDF